MKRRCVDFFYKCRRIHTSFIYRRFRDWVNQMKGYVAIMGNENFAQKHFVAVLRPLQYFQILRDSFRFYLVLFVDARNIIRRIC